ncbi:MAG TPA: GAF domain-containing protein, partial [Stellaceae bacterium]|nr:GAF domain-containing protein [Stellaceae bacterium]
VDLQQVLDTLTETAVRLCNADKGLVRRREGDRYALAASYGFSDDFKLWGTASALVASRDSIVGRAVLDRKLVHIPDVLAEPEWEGGDWQARGNFRSALAVPLLRGDDILGVLVLHRTEPLAFTQKQIELVETFAGQAAIAIENARLFAELTETLEQQATTGEILQAISNSPTDARLVLSTIAESAARLLDVSDVDIMRIEGKSLRQITRHGPAPQWPVGTERPINRDWVTGRAIVDRATIHVPDLQAAEKEFPEGAAYARNYGHRTTLATPLLREGEPIGAILIRRMEVRPFSPRQIKLLASFADQAVIAIENARLFEELARKSRELEIASQHKSQFVANMSHELRTPLAAILGYAELMQEGFYGPQSEKSIEALTRIRSNGKHLLGLINTVLDIAKIESGQFTLNLAEYALDGMVETVRVATESLAAAKKLALATDVAKALPIGIGDEQRLTQVLLNLVGNAIKFTDTGEVRIVAMASTSRFHIAVSDTGPGIPPEELERVFEQFHQVDDSNTRAKGGTGLGLTIAKQIVEMHGGRIWVESTVGKGATFRMELPIRAGGAA